MTQPNNPNNPNNPNKNPQPTPTKKVGGEDRSNKFPGKK